MNSTTTIGQILADAKASTAWRDKAIAVIMPITDGCQSETEREHVLLRSPDDVLEYEKSAWRNDGYSGRYEQIPALVPEGTKPRELKDINRAADIIATFLHRRNGLPASDVSIVSA